MRKAAAAVAILALAASASAGVVTKVRDNGPDSNRVVIVIVAEGYTAAEQAAFDAAAESTLIDLFRTPPWSSYQGHANVYTDFVASNESGADKPAPCYASPVTRDTAFDARYCGGGTQRLLLVDFGRVLTEVNTAVPAFDLVGVLVNDPEYGGAGGPVLTFSRNASARSELFLHEHGHTFADLADEYSTPYPGYPPGDWEPNVDFDAVRGMVDWDPWILPATPLPTPGTGTEIGCFEGARYLTSGIYRPVNDCKMRTLNRAFCPVCSEAVVQSIYALVSPLDAATPADPAVSYDPCDPGAVLSFGVTPVLPADPAWIAVTWELDGIALPDTGFTLDLPAAAVGGAVSSLTATVRDATPLVRRPYLDPMSATATWTLRPATTGPDRDGDGVGDGCDCAPDDGAVSAPPAIEAGLLRVDRPSRLSWPATAPLHDVARGLVRDLGSGYAGDCIDAGAARALDDPDLPGPGQAFWYLVRSGNACGFGPWGAASAGGERTVAACP